jgi:hypothetical protein
LLMSLIPFNAICSVLLQYREQLQLQHTRQEKSKH